MEPSRVFNRGWRPCLQSVGRLQQQRICQPGVCLYCLRCLPNIYCACCMYCLSNPYCPLPLLPSLSAFSPYCPSCFCLPIHSIILTLPVCLYCLSACTACTAGQPILHVYLYCWSAHTARLSVQHSRHVLLVGLYTRYCMSTRIAFTVSIARLPVCPNHP